MNVLSYDLVPDGVYVIEADICAGIPLPGSEPDEGLGEGQIVDVAVCALSLMGLNWPKCIREAWRVLKPTCVPFPSFHTQTRTNDIVEDNLKLPRSRVDLKMSTNSSPLFLRLGSN